MSKSLAISYSMKKKKKASGGTVKSGDKEMDYSKGGKIKGVHPSIEPKEGESSAGHFNEASRYFSRKGLPSIASDLLSESKKKHSEKLSELKSMKGPTSGKSGFAEGGEVTEGEPAMKCPTCGSHGQTYSGYQDGSHELDMIERILSKRRMSHGGQVANETGEGVSACEKPNEFDYLVLNDDAEVHYDNDEEIGGPDKDDVVSKAMVKRRAKKRD